MPDAEDVAQVLKSFLTCFETHALTEPLQSQQQQHQLHVSHSVDEHLSSQSHHTPSSSPYKSKRRGGTGQQRRYEFGSEEEGAVVSSTKGHGRRNKHSRQRNFSDLTAIANRATSIDEMDRHQPQQQRQSSSKHGKHPDDSGGGGGGGGGAAGGGGSRYGNDSRYAAQEDGGKQETRRNMSRGTSPQRESHVRYAASSGGGGGGGGGRRGTGGTAAQRDTRELREAKLKIQPSHETTRPAEYVPGVLNEPTSLPSRMQRRSNRSPATRLARR